MPKKPIPIAQTSWNGWRRSRHWSSRARAITRARNAVSVGSSACIVSPSIGGAGPGAECFWPLRSGRHELVIVAMDPIAEPVAQRRTVGSRDRDRPHDLADVALLAEEVALLPHPRAHVRAVAVELERSRIDRRPVRPRDRRL